MKAAPLSILLTGLHFSVLAAGNQTDTLRPAFDRFLPAPVL
jgi:hypothetical protein